MKKIFSFYFFRKSNNGHGIFRAHHLFAYAQEKNSLFGCGLDLFIVYANDAGQLFPFVPAEEHAATLALLRALTPAQVDALRRELRRLPPNRRDAFRVQLLEQDAAGRAALLDPAP